MLLPILFVVSFVRAEEPAWRKSLDSLRQQAGKSIETGASVAGAKLSEDEIASGLKEALSVGVKKSVASLGKPDGFLKASDVRIPLPDKLKSMERLARKFGMGRKADEFEATLNRAAETAVVEAAEVFAGSLKKMTIQDARDILGGSEDAATRFFERTGRDTLAVKFLPVVHAATRKVGVTRSYESFRKSAGPLLSLTLGEPPNLDAYVTEKAMDGLFLRVAAEEKEIRRDPAARATNLLKKVFSAAPSPQ